MVRTTGEDHSERKVIDNIAAYGWHCMNILADGDYPGYAFTVGVFHSYKHPEFKKHGFMAAAVQKAKSPRT
jgi:hypothetical protein